MRAFLCCVFLILSMVGAKAQDTIFFPEYVTGERGFPIDLFQKFGLQAEAQKLRKSGVIVGTFTVDAMGKVVDAKVLRITEEAYRQPVLTCLSRVHGWTPGSFQGADKPFKFLIALSIVFADNEVKYSPPAYLMDSLMNSGGFVDTKPIYFKYSIPGSDYDEVAAYMQDKQYVKRLEEARALYDAGKINEALARYNELYPNEPSNPDVSYMQGECHYKLNELKKACKRWNRAAKLGHSGAEIRLEGACQ